VRGRICRSWQDLRSYTKGAEGGALHRVDEDIDRINAKVRARVEHPFW
jgi:hypothetical protein